MFHLCGIKGTTRGGNSDHSLTAERVQELIDKEHSMVPRHLFVRDDDFIGPPVPLADAVTRDNPFSQGKIAPHPVDTKNVSSSATTIAQTVAPLRDTFAYDRPLISEPARSVPAVNSRPVNELEIVFLHEGKGLPIIRQCVESGLSRRLLVDMDAVHKVIARNADKKFVVQNQALLDHHAQVLRNRYKSTEEFQEAIRGVCMLSSTSNRVGVPILCAHSPARIQVGAGGQQIEYPWCWVFSPDRYVHACASGSLENAPGTFLR